jgi:hypothetical protein
MAAIVSQGCPTVKSGAWTYPTNVRGIIHGMTSPRLRATLAANLRRMIEFETPRGARPSRRAWALSKGLDVRLVDRLAKGQHAITLDKLDEIAEACGLQAWHLLYEDFNPKSPVDAPITEEERLLLRRLRKLLGD